MRTVIVAALIVYAAVLVGLGAAPRIDRCAAVAEAAP